MISKLKSHRSKELRGFWRCLSFSAAFAAAVMAVNVPAALAVTNPQTGSVGLEATVSGPPPSQPPTVSVPSNSQTFSDLPITVAGLCQNGLLVEVFDNNVFVGSVECKSGSFTLQVSLFSGTNSLTAKQYDGLGQASPVSLSVKVTYQAHVPPTFNTQLLSLTSGYAERGVNPGQQLVWPITIAGGTAPYALSVDWGDKTKPQLLSEAFSGAVNLTHTYQASGTYTITIQATDKNSETAFLQVVVIVNGPAAIGQSSNSGNGATAIKTVTNVVWWPVALFIPLLVIAFWLGGRQSLLNLQKRLEKSDLNLQ